VLEDCFALAAESLVQCNAVVPEPQQPGQPVLAVFNRLASYVLAVNLGQIKRAEDRARIASVAADQVEHRKAVVVADDCLAVDDA